MATIDIKDVAGMTVKSVELNDAVFGIEPNIHVMHTVVRAYRAGLRQGTANTKTRGEVRGGGKKPWRQKGTGRARQGSTRAPQWTHGGVALGPKPRLYKVKLNKKVKRVAMFSALSSKVASGEMIVVDKIAAAEFKTKAMAQMLSDIGAGKKSLVVLPEKDEKVVKSLANIPGVKVTLANTLSVYDILNADSFVAAQDAVTKIEEVYAE